MIVQEVIAMRPKVRDLEKTGVLTSLVREKGVYICTMMEMSLLRSVLTILYLHMYSQKELATAHSQILTIHGNPFQQ